MDHDFVTHEELEEIQGSRARQDYLRRQRQLTNEIDSERIIRSLISRVSTLEDTVRTLTGKQA